MIITQSAATGGGPQLLPDQGSLFVFISGNNDPDVQMYTSPGGLSRALNQFIPPAGALKYAPLQTLGDPDMICRRIVWAILTTKQASCVLINDAAHWVVVSGCSVSKIPTNPDDDFEICSLTVLNPLPNTDPQGSTPFSLWKSEYMTAVPNSLGGIQYGGTFVAVAPAAVPPLQTLPAAAPMAAGSAPPPASLAASAELAQAVLPPGPPTEVAAQAERAAIPSAPPVGPSGLRRIAEAKRRAKTWITTPAFAGDADRARHYAHFLAMPPTLVHRLDHDRYYYIVPLHRRGGPASILVALDAETGDFIQSSVGPDDRSDLRAGLLLNRTQFEARFPSRVRVANFPATRVYYPTLVWRPCQESRTRFRPFHLTLEGDQKVYTRIDGARFLALNPVSVPV